MPSTMSRILTAACALAVSALTGCGQQAADAATAGDPASPCRLLTRSEVDAAMPGAKAGEPERTREKYGIHACQWPVDGGSFVLQTWTAEEGSTEEEIKGLALGIVDPLKPDSMDAVRFERFPNLGEEAYAIVEKTDPQRGILNDIALLVARKEGQYVVLFTKVLAREDRAKGLSALESLGRTAVGRL
jgi:hypothetical protein